MLPTRSSARNLVVICAATIGGIVVGGVSVLGVAVAVMEPPSRDAPAGSAVFDGQPHTVVRSKPDVAQVVPTPSPTPPLAAAAPATTQTDTPPPLAPAQAQPVMPVDTQAASPANAAPAVTASTQAAAASKDEPAENSNQQTSVKTRKTRKETRTAKSQDYSQPAEAANTPPSDTDMTRRHTVVVPVPDNAEQVRDDGADQASTEAPRPLFDFFGNFGGARVDDNRDVSSQPQPVQPQPPRGARNPRDRRVVIAPPQRRGQDDGDQDAVSNGPPQYSNWGNFFAYGRNGNWRN